VIAPLSKIAIVLEELSTATKKSFETVENDEEEGTQEGGGRWARDVEECMSNTKESIEKGQRRGARKKIHLTDAAAALVRMYEQAGKPFEWRFDAGKGTDRSPDPEFVGKGAQFVWKTMSAIDPDLTIGEVVTALKKLSSARATMSGNSSSPSAKSQTRKESH
jgi:hypothetical protein